MFLRKNAPLIQICSIRHLQSVSYQCVSMKTTLIPKIIYSGQNCLKQSSRILSLYYFEEWLIIFEYHEMTQFEFDRELSNPTKHEGLMKECNEISLCNILFFFHQSELDGKLTSWSNRCFKTKINIKLTVQNLFIINRTISLHGMFEYQ